MSGCACRRWGPGTTCERPINTENSRELDARMKALVEEREKQGNYWVSGGADKLTVAAPPKNEKTEPAQQLRFWN